MESTGHQPAGIEMQNHDRVPNTAVMANARSQDSDGREEQLPSPSPDEANSDRENSTQPAATTETAAPNTVTCGAPRHPSPQSVGSSTLVASPRPSNAGSRSLRCPPPRSDNRRSSITSTETLRKNWPRALTTQNVLAWSVIVLTIVTLVYSWHANKMGRWDNMATYFDYCDNPSHNESGCAALEGKELGAPPFSSLKHVWKRLKKRALVRLDKYNEEPLIGIPDDSTSLQPSYGIMASVFFLGVILTFIALFIYSMVTRRRAGEMRISDQSMARRELKYSNQGMSSGVDIQQDRDVSRDSASGYHAFVPADKVIERLKALNDSKSSLSSLNSRRSSNPWGRQRPWTTDSQSSLLSHAEMCYYDSDHDKAKWTKVSRSRDSSNSARSSTSTLKPRVLLQRELPTPPPSPPPSQSLDDYKKEDVRFSKIRRLFIPKPMSVFEHPPPELHEGDLKAAAAIVGAVGAATTGGDAMAKCPVDVTPDKGLPDSWMHTAPQDVIRS